MADPKYQFPNRWTQIGKLLFPGSNPEQQTGISLLEQKDRDLEDYLTHMSTVSAGALLAIGQAHSGGSSPGGTVCSTTITIPNDGGSYYLECIGTTVATIANPADGTTVYVHDIEPRIVPSFNSGWSGETPWTPLSFDWTASTVSGGLSNALGIPNTVSATTVTPTPGTQTIDLFWGYNASFSGAVIQVEGSLIVKLFSLP